MSSDDYEVIAYKLLSYLYGCLKEGRRVDVPAMRELAGCNEAYFSSVLKGLQDKGLVEGFGFDGLSGLVIDSRSVAALGDPTVTMDGAIYVRENSRMAKARAFLGRSFEAVLRAAIEAAMPRI